MNPQQEMVLTLFTKEVIEQAKKLTKSTKQIAPIDKYDMPFRLYKVNDRTVNLEILVQRMFGPTRKESFGLVRNMTEFFKPIGVYSIEKGFIFDKVSITLPKEFENVYKLFLDPAKISNNNEVKFFSLEENAVIAGFSMDAVVEARAMRDTSFKVNGLDVDIYMAHEGYPQLFLDDKYGLRGPVAAYFAQGPNSLNPMVNNKRVFDDLEARSLLSAYKAL
ncbi:hypothetical protein GCM10027048_03680 [Hymenobacter coalescens]